MIARGYPRQRCRRSERPAFQLAASTPVRGAASRTTKPATQSGGLTLIADTRAPDGRADDDSGGTTGSAGPDSQSCPWKTRSHRVCDSVPPGTSLKRCRPPDRGGLWTWSRSHDPPGDRRRPSDAAIDREAQFWPGSSMPRNGQPLLGRVRDARGAIHERDVAAPTMPWPCVPNAAGCGGRRQDARDVSQFMHWCSPLSHDDRQGLSPDLSC